tara:strand:+ start:420 stop:593 length:174 start_codon:yes stop_codon:yes gene_type:complete
MFPRYLDADCNTLSQEDGNTTVVGNTKVYTLPSGTKKVSFLFSGGSVSSYSAEATFN